jgi:hypothetical protein
MMPADPKLAAVSDALSRAHNASRHGSREAQTGAIGDRDTYVRALLTRAQSASSAWANWEAINDQLGPGSSAASAINWLGLSAAGDIRMSLARDAILGAFSLSDPFEGVRLTLCQLASRLDDGATRIRLAGREWVIDQGYPPFLVDNGASENAKRINRIRSLVVSNWKSQAPTDPELANLRTLLRSTRNHVAHALDTEIADLPTIDQIRRFMELTLDLATDAAVIWCGSAVGADRFREVRRKEAIKFWQYAFAEPIAAWERDMELRRTVGIEP